MCQSTEEIRSHPIIILIDNDNIKNISPKNIHLNALDIRVL